MTTDERRAVVRTVRARFALSERRTCRFLGFERTALPYQPVRPLRDAPLRAKLRELAGAYARWGVPRLYWRLRRDGSGVDYKLMERLYHLEGLAVRRRKRKRLAVVAAHSLPALAVIAALEPVIARRGPSTRLSLDNGTEFRSVAFDAWAEERGIELHFIQPGKPVQNSHLESFNGRLRDECLNQHYFVSLRDAQFQLDRWRQDYNSARPHTACHPLTPSEFAQTFRPIPSPPALLSA